MNTRFLLFVLFLISLGCKNDTNSGNKNDQSYLEKEYEKTKADSTFNKLVQAYGRAIIESEDSAKKEVLLTKAVAICDAPEKIYFKELFITELLKVNPKNEKAADYLYSLAQSMDFKNKIDAASMLYSGFCKRFPNDPRVTEAIKKVNEAQKNTAEYFKNLAKDIFNNPGEKGVNQENVLKFIDLSESFALAFPDDKMAPVYLFQAADMSRALGSLPKVISLYDWIYLYFPQYPKASLALFLKGFTMDSDLKKYDDAKIIYEKFLAKYPQDSLAKDAQFLLENLGKSDDELFKEMEMEKK